MSFNQPFTSLHTESLTLFIIYLRWGSHLHCDEFAITHHLKNGNFI